MFLLDIAFQQGFVLVEGKHLDYSTMRPGGCRSLYRHPDGREISWGLNEAHKPPTLCHPRPKITKTVKASEFEYTKEWYIKDPNTIIHLTEQFDCCMHEVLEKYSHAEILEAMYNPNKIFNL